MKITRVVIENFCSIAQSVFEPREFSILVGQNNHGKTNFFKAIEWFYSGKGSLEAIRFKRTGQLPISVELEFEGLQEALQSMKNAKHRASVDNITGGRDRIRIRRSGVLADDVKNRTIFNEEKQEWRNVTGIDPALNDLLPVLQYVDTATHLSDVAKFSKTSAMGSMLSGVLAALLETSRTYREFRQKFTELFEWPESDVRIQLDSISRQVEVYIRKQFPDCTEVAFKFVEPAFDDLLKTCSAQIDDGIKTEADEKGDGMQRALMLSILQTYADHRRSSEAFSKGFLFLIDEAELHLHPSAQRLLKRALLDITSRGEQVFIATHSSVLVVEDNDLQGIFKVEKCNHESAITDVHAVEKPALVYELLGGSPVDLLLPRNFLIVEGKSEELFLRKIIARFFPDEPTIQIVYAEGDHETQRESMTAINRVLVPALHGNPIYKNRLVILCDLPSPQRRAHFDEFVAAYRSLTINKQLFVLPFQSLEEYYPGEFHRTAAEVHVSRNAIHWKKNCALAAGQGLTAEEFTQGMPIVFEALRRCWSLAYS